MVTRRRFNYTLVRCTGYVNAHGAIDNNHSNRLINVSLLAFDTEELNRVLETRELNYGHIVHR